MIELKVTAKARALSTVMKKGSKIVSFEEMNVEFENEDCTRVERVQLASLRHNSIFTLTDYDNKDFLNKYSDLLVAAMIAARRAVVQVGKTTFYIDYEFPEEKVEEETKVQYNAKFDVSAISSKTIMGICCIAAAATALIIGSSYFENN